MDTQTVIAALVITAACILYTAGVFSERRRGRLEPAHLALFWLGLACDATGTGIMSVIAGAEGGTPAAHAVTGTFALCLMLFHAVWASIVLARGNEKAQEEFHRLSIAVWLFWLVPYLCGLLMGIPALRLPASTAMVCAGVGSFATGAALCLSRHLCTGGRR